MTDVPEPEKVTIFGVTYDVMSAATAAEHAASGQLSVARMMYDNRQARRLALRLPDTDEAYFAVQFMSGNFSTVSALGFKW